ncbi:MAG TPA: flagellar assembly protein A [Symbiobacteriaceae bacterium]
MVHDPVGNGRYATLAPGPGIRLWINGQTVEGPTVVTATDEIRYEILPDNDNFMDLEISADGMTVTMTLTADPFRQPDTVTLEGRQQAQLKAACSPRARSRAVAPKQLVMERLKELGVVYGIDEAAVEQALKGPIGQPVVIARGQEPQKPVRGEWVWRLGELSLVEAGQVIALYQGGQPNKPRITVRGEVTKVYEDVEGGQPYLPGEGTRLLGGDRLVASVPGRARAVSTPEGLKVHVFPVRQIDGDVEGMLESEADVIIRGGARGAKIRAAGEVLVMGDVERSEIHAEVITIRGEATDSYLYTIPKGHFLPMKGDLAWIRRSLEGIRETLSRHAAVKEETFREVQNHVRVLRRRAEEIGLSHPEYVRLNEELAQVFMGARAADGLDLVSVTRLLEILEKMAAEAENLTGRNVSVQALAHVTVWAGGDILVQERVANSALFCGGSIRTPEEAILTQSELVAGEEVTLGTLATLRGTAPVVVRAGGRMLIDQIEPGCVLEIGSDRREIKNEMIRVVAGVNARGQLVVRQRD